MKIRKSASFWTSVSIGACLVLLTSTPMILNSLGISDGSKGTRRSDACGGEGGSVYPDDLILSKPYDEDPNRWAVMLHCVGIVYMLIGLNTVCDVCFSGALEVMVEQWNVQPDVAGATFMAAGGSAPELFTSLIGVFAETDVGFGTIVGSAVFNVLFVIGLCGYFAKDGIALTWWPLFRDCSYYLFGLAVLAYCASDEEIHLWEAIMLFCLYLVYLVIMWNNPELEIYATSKFQLGHSKTADDEGDDLAPAAQKLAVKGSQVMPEPEPKPEPLAGSIEAMTVQSISTLSLSTNSTASDRMSGRLSLPAIGTAAPDALTAKADENSTAGTPIDAAAAEAEDDGADAEEDDDDDEEDLMEIPEETFDKVVWYFCCPIYFILHYGTPEPTTDDFCGCGIKRFIATFVISLCWIAIFSYLLVWWVEVLGQVLGVDTIIMGFTLLAAGTSIPDAVSSVHFAAKGEGDMAISSSIGSNIFDILVGLPIPWMLKTGVVEPIANGAISTVTICSPYITAHVLLLLFMVLAVILSIHFLDWTLNRTLGLIMGILYLIFLVVACIVEFSEPEWLKF